MILMAKLKRDLVHFNGRNLKEEGGAPQELTSKNQKRRQNLTIITDALASRIIFDGKKSSRNSLLKKRQEYTVNAKSEVLLSCAFNSPQLLQLSGVGNPELLNKHNISVVHELKGVGENLQDQNQRANYVSIKSSIHCE